MTLQQLEYVLAIDRFRHFAQAAAHCRVTQPTLSAMLQKLEEELGAKVFDRARQPLAPTPVGRLVIDRAREVLAQAAGIRQLVDEARHAVGGTFKLGVLPTIAPYLLPRFCPALMKKYPDLDLRVMEMKTAQIKQSLLNGGLDAGIVARLDDMETFAATPLFFESFLAYVASSEPLSACTVVKSSDLQGRPLWLLDEGHCFRDQLARYCRQKSAQVSQLAYHLGSIETFMRMVECGQGITFIPELATLQPAGVQRELVRPFAIPTPAREIVLLTRRDFIRHTLAQALVAEIRAAVPEEMHRLRRTQVLV